MADDPTPPDEQTAAFFGEDSSGFSPDRTRDEDDETDLAPPTVGGDVPSEAPEAQTQAMGSEFADALPPSDPEENTAALPTEDDDELTPATREVHETDHEPRSTEPAVNSGASWGTVEHSGHFEPGQLIFNRYVVKKKLGQGGMGDVWLVTHRELNADRALKVIVSRIAFDGQARVRFKREAQIMASFHHPNAVVVHDARLTEQDVAYIDMEFVQGQSLSDVLRKGEPMPLGWIARVLDQLCDVLETAHKKGIVHRDLKPANLMLLADREHGKEHLKVLDFGIAKILTDAEQTDAGPHTQTGAFLGTPFYASPEQIDGLADTRSDIYSVGVILFEFLTGHRPFTGPATRVFVDVSNNPPPPFAQVNPQVEYPPEVEALVMRCLAKSPADRPQTANEVAEQFRAALPHDAARVAKVKEAPPRSYLWLKIGAAIIGVGFAVGLALAMVIPRPVPTLTTNGSSGAAPIDPSATAKLPEGFAAAPKSDVDVSGLPTVLTAIGKAAPLNLRMVVIQGGTFAMGQPPNAHEEIVGDFAISDTEVTNGQMKTYFQSRGIATYPEKFEAAIQELKSLKVADREIDDHPAVGITHATATDFAKWAGGLLPTEAQWEYAARSRGLSDRYYAWPDTIPPTRELTANSGEVNIDNIDGRTTTTAPTRSYPKDQTEQHVFDLMGNVREWCRDPAGQPDTFVVRGGSYLSMADLYSNFAREFLNAKETLPDLGFRIVVDMPPAGLKPTP